MNLILKNGNPYPSYGEMSAKDNQMNYLEKDCTVEHQGQKFTNNGAFVSQKHIVAYLGKDGQLQDWHGKRLGQYWITSTWKTPRSYVSNTMNQVLAVCDGIEYTGRSAGIGMIFKGRVRK
jgi:hypothetical protein